MKNYCFIINPAAGGGSCLKKFREAETVLQAQKIFYQVSCSKKPGELHSLVQKALNAKADCIVVVGGDGTVREAVSAIAYQPVDFFIFPFGTGNDLSKALGISTNPLTAAEQLLQGKASSMDAVQANDSWFLNVGGFGFDVEVLLQTEHYKKRMSNKNAYLFGLIQALFHLKSRSVTLTHDGERETLYAMIVSAGNGQYIGGGMQALPMAKVDDGLLDICVMHNVKKRRIPAVLLRFLKGRHMEIGETRYFQTKELMVETEIPLPVQLDGEIIEQTPVTFRLHPGAVRLLR